MSPRTAKLSRRALRRWAAFLLLLAILALLWWLQSTAPVVFDGLGVAELHHQAPAVLENGVEGLEQAVELGLRVVMHHADPNDPAAIA